MLFSCRTVQIQIYSHERSKTCSWDVTELRKQTAAGGGGAAASEAYLVLGSGSAEDGVEAVLSLLVLPHVLQGELVRDDEGLLLAPAPLKLQHGAHPGVHPDLALHVLHHVEVLLAHDALVLQEKVKVPQVITTIEMQSQPGVIR